MEQSFEFNKRKYLPRAIVYGAAVECILAGVFFLGGGIKGFNVFGILIAILHLPMWPLFLILPPSSGKNGIGEPVAAYAVGFFIMGAIWSFLFWLAFTSQARKSKQVQPGQDPKSDSGPDTIER